MSKPQDALPRLISAKRAAEESGIPYASLRDAAHRGLIPVVRINRAWYFDRADIEAFILKHKETLS